MNTCIDCVRPISWSATRCRSCARRHEWSKGRTNRWSPTGRSAIADSNRRRTRLPKERFWAKVAEPNSNGCREWLGRCNRNGYGQFYVNGRMVSAYKWLWEQTNGPVPDGLELDHKCRNRACIEPSHLEPVTHQVNIRRGNTGGMGYNQRKTHCKRGHPFSGNNLYLYPNGDRGCRACTHAHHDKYKSQKRVVTNRGKQALG